MKQGRFLGIDYGAKRIGLAVSDERHMLAFPKTILLNSGEVLIEIRKIVDAEEISEIVIGDSLDLKGLPNPISRDIDDFAQKLELFGLPVHKEKEFLTSVEARRSLDSIVPYASDRNERADSAAAALILQRYLDRRNTAASDYR